MVRLVERVRLCLILFSVVVVVRVLNTDVVMVVVMVNMMVDVVHNRMNHFSVVVDSGVMVLDEVVLVVVDWVMLVVLVMSLFNCFLDCLDGLGGGSGCRSWSWSSDYGNSNWLLLFYLNRFELDSRRDLSFIGRWWGWIGLLLGLFSRFLVLLVMWVKLLFPVVLMLAPVMIKVVQVLVMCVVMLMPFALKLIRILNVVVAVLVRIVVVELVRVAVLMMTMESVGEVVVFVPVLLFLRVALTRRSVVCTLSLGVPFTMTITVVVACLYIDNFVVGLLGVAIGMTFLVLNGIIVVVRHHYFVDILVSRRSMPQPPEFLVRELVVIGAILVSLMVHIAVKLLPHVTVLVLLMSMAVVVLVEAVIVVAFGEGLLMGSVVGVRMVWVVYMVKVIDFPVVVPVNMANVMMINDNISVLTSVIVIVMIDVFRLCMADKSLCCFCCMLVEQM